MRELSGGSGSTTHRASCDKDFEGVFASSSASWLEICIGVFKDDIKIGLETVRMLCGVVSG